MRSNPTGGEQGDGTETGQDYENTVKRAVAFFYQGSGVNAEGTTRIQAAVPFTFTGSGTEGSNGIDRVYTTTPQTVDLENGTYHLLLVANPAPTGGRVSRSRLATCATTSSSRPGSRLRMAAIPTS